MLGFNLGPFRAGFVVDNVTPGLVSVRLLRVFPSQYHSTNAPHPHKFISRLLLPEVQTVKVFEPSTSNALADNKKHWNEKKFDFFFKESSLSR